eukprot:6578479-Alexandrium_andersonii.AAC.1
MQDSAPREEREPGASEAGAVAAAEVVPSAEPSGPAYSAVPVVSGPKSALQLAETDPNIVLAMMLQQHPAEQQDRAQLAIAVQTALTEFRSVGEAVRAGQSHMSLLTAEVRSTQARQEASEAATRE